jgi:hypothetical protein
LTSLKAFKSVNIHKNKCFEKALGMVVRNLPWVPGQVRHALTRVGVPELDRLVFASTGNCTVETPCNREHPAFAMRWVSTRSVLTPECADFGVCWLRQRENHKIEKKEEKRKKISPIWMPPQGRHALTRLRVPDLDGLVTASTGYVLPVWAVNHRTDPAIAMRWVKHMKQLRQGKNIRFLFFNLTNMSARSAGTQIGEIKKKID